jgi:hypothetical protein
MVATRLALLLVLIILLAGCLREGQRHGGGVDSTTVNNGGSVERPSPIQEQRDIVAVIHSDEASMLHVEAALEHVEVPVWLDGSRGVCSVRVPRSLREKAVLALKDDAQRRGYWIQFFEEKRSGQ